VWVGHSCPTLLILLLALLLLLFLLSVQSETVAENSGCMNCAGIVGQECPTHTGIASPLVQLIRHNRNPGFISRDDDRVAIQQQALTRIEGQA
jgi:hypothetical protein